MKASSLFYIACADVMKMPMEIAHKIDIIGFKSVVCPCTGKVFIDKMYW